MSNIESNKGEIVMYQPDQSVIARHIRNIYKEEELDEEGTYAKFAYMHVGSGTLCLNVVFVHLPLIGRFAGINGQRAL